ncbi:MAG: permease [Candidatus Peribacteraceae bacterium]|nr:permease [Candidatus Peribacteraceae bacterium]MDD5074705.1 permease [Candidatus Peribacteraceae bacterium]
MALFSFIADSLTFRIFGLAPESHLGEAVRFFIEDTLKIFLLLLVISFAVSFVRTFLPPEKVRKILVHRFPVAGNVLAALIGIITPFCTCSAIPLFLGFLEAGVPLGVTFSFLVASPMVNEVALVLLLSMFGWKIALLYAVSGVAIAIFAGVLIGLLRVEHLVVRIPESERGCGCGRNSAVSSLTDRLARAGNYSVNIVRRVWLYIVIGVGIGAWMHGYVPADALVRFAGADKWYAVPFATLIGIPLYANAAGIMPLVGVLTEKGVAIGTSLAFMMAVTGLSLPEFLILRKVMHSKLIFLFAATVGAGIIFIGYLFNILLV